MAQTNATGSPGFVRVDRFNVSAAGRDELLRRIQETHEVLRAQRGYVRDYVLERANPSDGVGLMTIVEWDGTARPETVRDAVREMHRRANFDPNEMYARLRVEADIETYHETRSLVSPSAASASGTYENDPADELPFDDAPDTTLLKRATVRRRYTGDIAGSSTAHVMMYRSTADRVGYVATDIFDGAVAGRKGGFVFQHGGSIDRGVLRPFGYVVPGSGSGELAGIMGDIEIAFVPPATHTIALTYRFE